MTTDADLVRATLGGDLDAFEALVRRHQDAVFAFVRSRLADHAAADDVAQEAFIAAHRGLRSLDDPARFLRWLLGIARHKLLEHLRGASRRPERGAADLDALPAPATGEDPEAVLGALFAGLPDEARAVALLRWRDDLGYREIAERLGIPEGTVATILHRARRVLQENHERLLGEVRR